MLAVGVTKFAGSGSRKREAPKASVQIQQHSLDADDVRKCGAVVVVVQSDPSADVGDARHMIMLLCVGAHLTEMCSVP